MLFVLLRTLLRVVTLLAFRILPLLLLAVLVGLGLRVLALLIVLVFLVLHDRAVPTRGLIDRVDSIRHGR
ncbi:hypothetical protein CSC65_09965 [Pseudoxanthomonas daejeonensis]|uniref:Transmembrane protein n=1 Tax=Pseudoxanthomonas daejeonensis TaxID=266062 RepID=A0ABQ6Z629_9GAMM|nr:hypothetical protein CSC65_09965 [Pseudoxanthomonas daejeonensis]